jgi:hypothetical protein
MAKSWIPGSTCNEAAGRPGTTGLKRRSGTRRNLNRLLQSTTIAINGSRNVPGGNPNAR